ncbi:MAG: hypothetical protein HONBIEJF_01428 [Fimbriimonadaceae bacterium]|nr:hypothetical protein [Fimbriimonadaceae bacterium]
MAVGLACSLDIGVSFLLLFVLVPVSGARRQLAAVAIAAGLLLAPRLELPNQSRPTLVATDVVVISQSVATHDGQRADISVAGTRYRMYFGDQDVALGDTLRIVGEVRPPNEFSENYFRDHRLAGWVAPSRIETTRRGPEIWHVARSIRESFTSSIRAYLSEESAALVDAICFNVDADLDLDTYDALSRTGTIHIISTSGLHVLILATFLGWLLAPLPIPRPVALGILCLLLLLYCGAAGLRPPAVRATMMAMIGYSAYLFRRSPDPLSALAAFVILELLVSPTSLLDRSFQFSCVIVAGLILLGRIDDEGIAFRDFRELVQLSWIASLVSAPLVAYVFGRVSWLSIVANLLIAPAITVLTVGALLMWGFGAVSAGLARGVGRFLEGLCQYVVAVVQGLSDLRWSVLELPPFSGLWLVPAFAAILWTWRPYVRPA